MNKDRLSIQSSLRIFLDPTELGTELLRIAHYILASLRIGMKDSKTPEKIPRSFWKLKEIPEISFKKKIPKLERIQKLFVRSAVDPEKQERIPLDAPTSPMNPFKNRRRISTNLSSLGRNLKSNWMNPPRIPQNPSMFLEERPETKQMADLKGSIPVAATCYPTSNESTLKTRLQLMKSYRSQLKIGIETSLVICSTKFMFHFGD